MKIGIVGGAMGSSKTFIPAAPTVELTHRAGKQASKSRKANIMADRNLDSLSYNRLERLYALALWDNDGRMYMPLFGYNDAVVAYAPAAEALPLFLHLEGVPIWDHNTKST